MSKSLIHKIIKLLKGFHRKMEKNLYIDASHPNPNSEILKQVFY